ncbi:glycerol-3-phosphate 1-O-acyltransferase PlsY [Parvibium lacunae]|uniref:Glycerol-3-phosphate acyltransferase n=1 Tax=Parvibium lacunae TaxID=1888893 RepID=A0A368KYJ8_9BURK|nr:glycerol-3-phosphate 1-O-acyltransferase PlsY [Parvibium lacunae]RCS56507.1 glycerol-3-phosphate 1-O-acyltransferase PlsY [Parvibium lacunae]
MSLVWIMAAYLVGSLSFAILVSKVFHMADPRSYGSGNPGATNVLRSGNKIAAALTLIGDALKGWLIVFLCQRYATNVTDGLIALVAVAVFMGHLYPIFFKFRGGKGVATAAGILFALNLTLGAATVAVWLATVLIFRISSLGALVASLFAPFFYILHQGIDAIAMAIMVMCGWLLYRHRDNIARLMQGKESKVGKK